MKSIFEYTNYRLFLKDFYEEQKAEIGFTYRDFANLAGMNSTSWLLNLINGKKNLSSDTIIQVAKALKLNKTETQFLEALVPFTQAKTNDVKDHYYQKLIFLKKKLKITNLNEDQYDYYTKWYHPVIRSLVTKMDFTKGKKNHDFALLGSCLIPPISAAEAKKSVQLLEKLNLIQKDGSGKYTLLDSIISTGDETSSINIINYHKRVSRLAEIAHDLSPKEERDISSLTLGINEKNFHLIKSRIQNFRKEIMNLAIGSEDSDRVYQLNFQFFPMAKAVKK